MKPYGLISDQHFHNWSAFSSVNECGVNTRLEGQLSELRRCADEVKKAGGDTIINAGDTFHQRGSLTPSVLNPVLDLHRELIAEGFKIIIVAGNHDAELRDVTRLSSAITALENVGCTVINEPLIGGDWCMFPWFNSVEELKKSLLAIDPVLDRSLVDLILHAPLDGVISGIPDHGLDPAWLASLGFRRVMSGHYHSHKQPAPNVYSIGASAHHTWGDVDTKAGFLIVSDAGVKWHKSHAPEFVEIDASMSPADIPLIVDGNYCRARISSSKQKDVEELRAFLTDCGAKGVVILSQPAPAISARTGSTISAGASMESSVSSFIKSQSYGKPDELAALCLEILNEARSIA